MDKAQALLRLYRDNAREIDRLEAELARWRSRAEKVTASYSPAPAHMGDDRIQAAVDELTALQGDLTDRLCGAMQTRRNIQRAIDSVEDARLRLLLELYYLDGLTWERVAERMHLEYRWVRRLHQRALRLIDPRKPPLTRDIV